MKGNNGCLNNFDEAHDSKISNDDSNKNAQKIREYFLENEEELNKARELKPKELPLRIKELLNMDISCRDAINLRYWFMRINKKNLSIDNCNVKNENINKDVKSEEIKEEINRDIPIVTLTENELKIRLKLENMIKNQKNRIENLEDEINRLNLKLKEYSNVTDESKYINGNYNFQIDFNNAMSKIKRLHQNKKEIRIDENIIKSAADFIDFHKLLELKDAVYENDINSEIVSIVLVTILVKYKFL